MNRALQHGFLSLSLAAALEQQWDVVEAAPALQARVAAGTLDQAPRFPTCNPLR